MDTLHRILRFIILVLLFWTVQAQAQLSVERTCPPVESLYQDSHRKTWFAPGGWYSNNPSFFRELGRFVGAQWVGVSVGRVICSYTGKNQSTFVVHLQRNELVPSPTGGLWQKDEGGYKNCFSNDPHQCGYVTMVPPEPKSVYDQIDFYGDQPAEHTP